MGNKRIKKNFDIPDPRDLVNTDDSIKFSFKFYDTSCKDFCLSRWGENYIALSLERLQDISRKKFCELGKGNSYHFHEVRWEQTTKKSGFPIKDANYLNAFQFSLAGINNQKARVFGAYANNTFYIIWFDLEHEIWPSFKKNT